jgi:hypothetical protein
MLKNSIISFFFLNLFIFIANSVYGQLKAIKLDSAQLPKGIKYTGRLKGAIEWNDQLGDNIVITVETGTYRNPKFKHEDDGLDAELFAYHCLLKYTLEQTWKVYDFIQDCGLDIEASIIKNTLRLTDLNNDGIGRFG